jgi:hypothetical protein
MRWFLRKIQALLARLAQPDFEGIEEIGDDGEKTSGVTETAVAEIPHAEPGAFQAVKSAIKGHGEQTILPDDCEFGDNDLCYVEA